MTADRPKSDWRQHDCIESQSIVPAPAERPGAVLPVLAEDVRSFLAAAKAPATLRAYHSDTGASFEETLQRISRSLD